MNFSSLLGSASPFFASDPSVFFMQLLAIGAAALVVFFVLYATRDVILRSHSFLVQIGCILLVAVLPFVGYLLYLLIRPSRTLRERKVESQVAEILSRLNNRKSEQQKQHAPRQHARKFPAQKLAVVPKAPEPEQNEQKALSAVE